MKRLLFVFAMTALVGGLAFSQDSDGGGGGTTIIIQNTQTVGDTGGSGGGGSLGEEQRRRAISDVERLVRQDAFRNAEGRAQLTEASAILEYEYRALLYDKFKRTNRGNGFWLNVILPGLGSLLKGDILGGLLVAGGVVGGAALYLAVEPGTALRTVGNIISGTAYIYGLFRPRIFVKIWNKQLQEGLGTYYTTYDYMAPTPTLVRNDNLIEIPLFAFEF